MTKGRPRERPIEVLLVEDNPGDARLLEELMSEVREGEWELDWVRTTAEATDRLRDGAGPDGSGPDAVLLDLSLPDSEGLETVRTITAAAPGVPIVVLTGHRDPELGGTAVREGAQDYLEKGDVTAARLSRSLRYARERMRAERRIRRQERRFRALIANITDVISVVDPGGTIRYESPSAKRVLGYEPEELVGEDILDYVHPEDRDRVRRQMQELGGEPGGEAVGEARFRHADGSYRLLEARGRTPPEGTEIGGVIIASRDVTETRHAEEALRRAQEMFEGVFETSPVGLEIVDAETKDHRAVNEVFTEQFGYSRREVQEGAVRDRDLWTDPEMRDRVYERVEEGESVRNVDVTLRRRDGSTFDALFSASPLELEDRRYVVGAIQDISYLKEVERELKHRALHDNLTGLPNRALFDDRLGHAIERSQRTGESLAVLFVDLKRFKVINDSLGHEAGDRALQTIAERLLAAVREPDTVARIGGDEFTVLLEDVGSEEGGQAAAARILGSFEEPVELGGREVAVEASVGVAVHSGGTEERPAPTDILRWADEAMYRAKSRPGTAQALADPDHPATDTSRIEREARFRRALEAGEIDTVYQPIFGVRDVELRGVEALARWRDPVLGEVSPGAFIPMAEETGLIVELGEQQMEEACRGLLSGQDLGGRESDRPLRLHLNLSSHQLEDPEVVERVRRVLERTGFPAERLCLEVTESAAAREPGAVDRLGELGVELAIDDFGTAYSTLAQLKRLRVDALKIDRSFVAGLPEDARDRAIVESVLTLGHALGLVVVAEGVETAGQLELLRELGGDEVQGFHLARPMPLEELGEWAGSRA